MIGLILAEVEFADDEEMRAYCAPDFVGREVADDRRYTGGELVTHGIPDGPRR